VVWHGLGPPDTFCLEQTGRALRIFSKNTPGCRSAHGVRDLAQGVRDFARGGRGVADCGYGEVA
jgi:hypothetical protein